MKKIRHSVLLLALGVGIVNPGVVLAAKIKYHEHPALRTLKAEHRANKAERKMRAKQPLFHGF